MSKDPLKPNEHSPENFVDAAIHNPDTPVVLFSLSWCSFCRALKQLLDSLQIDYCVYELDRGDFLEPSLQRTVRSQLAKVGNSGTLPQLFIGTNALGGYTDVIAAGRKGSLQALLQQHSIPHKIPTESNS